MEPIRMNSPKISVIVPVYNVEKYIARFLDSAINQTYKDLEIICINDGSNDKSLKILAQYGKTERRIKVIEADKNMGGGGYYARNAGLKAAAGEYIAFADSDDYLEPDFYEQLTAEALKTNADIICGSTKWLNDRGEVTRITAGPLACDDVKKNFGKILSSLQHGGLWDKLYAEFNI
jgi:glycosyltransferase involved in cell wall biosynthesis